MKERLPVEAGRVAESRAGRDKGAWYVVLTDPRDGRVSVADGRGRPLSRPKPKNVKHLAAKPWVLPDFAAKAAGNPERLGQEIRELLDAIRSREP